MGGLEGGRGWGRSGRAFWNVAGLGSKDKGFWLGLGDWDVVILMETWVEDKKWGKIRERLPRGFEWGVQMARRKGRRGRAMGGMLMGIRKELLEERSSIEVKEERIMVGRVKNGGERWRIVGVYVGGYRAVFTEAGAVGG